jgi:hypothetical protein
MTADVILGWTTIAALVLIALADYRPLPSLE